MRALGLGAALVLAGDAFAAAPSPVALDLERHAASSEVRRVADWVLGSKDNERRPYVIIDKANARVFVFDAGGTLKGADAALLGMARGDRVAEGSGGRQLAAIGPKDRITPAGRFLANLDLDADGREVLLVDYDASIALHPVVKGTVAERRAERLASASAADNRISFGCINVPAALYRDVVSVLFARTDGYVYILPEAGEAAAWFGPPAPASVPGRAAGR